jgi:selenocysteine lyase/cysteine desulfurase
VQTALTTYANVHRGTGNHSEATTILYERARDIIVEHFGLDGAKNAVIFTSSLGANILSAQFRPDQYRVLSSQDLHLPLGVRAFAFKRKTLLKRIPHWAGGGTVKLTSPDSVVWADTPDRFEAGTPGIVNIIAMVCALQLTRCFGKSAFQVPEHEEISVNEILYNDEFSRQSGVELLNGLKETIVGFGIPVPTTKGSRPYTNLDNAASTKTFFPVWNSVCQAWRQPESVRNQIVDETKRICAGFLGAPSEEYTVVFTSNTTEAINIVASKLRDISPEGIEPVVLNTLLEHNSNELPWRHVPESTLLRLSVDEEGFVDLQELTKLLESYNAQYEHGNQRIVVVAISGASNILGACNDLEEICRIAHQYGARVLVDAAQLAAHRRIEMVKWGIDYLALSGHKLYAPFGSGVLVTRKDIIGRNPVAWEEIITCGEENVVGIAAIGKAMVLLQRIGMALVEAEERRLTVRVIQGLSSMPDVEIWGIKDPESPRFRCRSGIIAFNMKLVPHNQAAQELADRGGIGVRNGCHCAHLLVRNLLGITPLRHKIAVLGLRLFPRLAVHGLPGTVRVSLGIGNDERDIDHFLRTMQEINDAPRSHRDRFWAATYNGIPFFHRTKSIEAQMQNLVEALVAEVYGPHHDGTN